VFKQTTTNKTVMKFFLKFRTYLLITLYNAYFLGSLANSCTITGNPVEHSATVLYWTQALDPTTGQLFLVNDENASTFKTKPIQVKKETVFVTSQFFILKTYIQHNDLHFNIPLICFKFAVSQHTADG
jgi:hypothetical protein